MLQQLPPAPTQMAAPVTRPLRDMTGQRRRRWLLLGVCLARLQILGQAMLRASRDSCRLDRG
jgi:hypothetical protein